MRTDGDFGAFNLGGHVGDDPVLVEANRRALATELDVPRDRLLFMAQCHGVEVARVEEPWRGDPPAVDGIVTTNPDLALAVLVADCVPVLLADANVGVVAAVHAGRPGMLGGIVPAALEVMRGSGARHIRAAVGPSVCGRCYEVPEQLRDAAAKVSPASVAVSWTGTPAIDVAAGVVEQLVARGVAVTWVPGCTRESPHLYSYRRQARTGRFAGVVRGVRR
ncbi:MAG: peptidoglycan editing factor PgeF [Micrococcales bacterium]|nr:peptidoglycan editing factor PgeF [Micrococcales bacterium]